MLDTGLDLEHPDFQGRAITSESFVSGQAVQDGNGHGTHCIGTALGRAAAERPALRVAYEAEIFAGKVLSNAGSGSDSPDPGRAELGGRQRCAVVSMSLGAPVRRADRLAVFETVAQRARTRAR